MQQEERLGTGSRRVGTRCQSPVGAVVRRRKGLRNGRDGCANVLLRRSGGRLLTQIRSVRLDDTAVNAAMRMDDGRMRGRRHLDAAYLRAVRDRIMSLGLVRSGCVVRTLAMDGIVVPSHTARGTRGRGQGHEYDRQDHQPRNTSI